MYLGDSENDNSAFRKADVVQSVLEVYPVLIIMYLYKKY